VTLFHLAHAVYHTLRICVPTVVQSGLGTLTTPTCDVRLDSWSEAIVRHARIALAVEGVEHASSDESFVVMSNHQSLYDIPVLFQALRPRRLRMVAKSELFRVPIWAGAMRAAGFVEVNRRNRIAAMRSLTRAREAIASGTSIWIAPEGTRGEGAALGSFKKGGFHLAIGAKARILPVGLVGTDRVLPARGRRVVNGQHVRVVVSPPIATEGREKKVDELMAEVRAALERALVARP
jgi:1-acyl-sn-glycerol-3-phosphate acyltransferase